MLNNNGGADILTEAKPNRCLLQPIAREYLTLVKGRLWPGNVVNANVIAKHRANINRGAIDIIISHEDQREEEDRRGSHLQRRIYNNQFHNHGGL